MEKNVVDLNSLNNAPAVRQLGRFGVVEESIIDLNSVYNPPIWQVRSNSITYLNNHTSAGTLIQGQIYETSQFAEELATLI